MQNKASATELKSVLNANSAFVVIDMQRDYCVPGGVIASLGYDVSHFAEVASRLNDFMSVARTQFQLTIFVRTLFPDWRPSRARMLQYERSALHRVRDPAVTEWFGVAPCPGDIVIDKFRYSAFVDTTLDAILRSARIETLVVCGATTDVCVDTTVRDGFMRDYSMVVLSDCCGGSTAARHEHALDVLDGFFARVHTAEEVAKALGCDVSKFERRAVGEDGTAGTVGAKRG